MIGVVIKKMVYIALFACLGFIFQLAIHAVLETAYITLLISNFKLFGLGLSWDAWFAIHEWFTGALVLAGVAAGVWQGFYWWPRLYDEQGKVRDLPWRHNS